MRKGRSNPSVTIRDIAKEAGFAASTVSIVLNNAPLARYIRAATKQKIEDVAKKLRYSPINWRGRCGVSATTPSA